MVRMSVTFATCLTLHAQSATSLRDFEVAWPLKTSASTPLPLVTIGQALRGARLTARVLLVSGMRCCRHLQLHRLTGDQGTLEASLLLQPTALADPTFLGVAVLYRRRPPPTLPARLLRRARVAQQRAMELMQRIDQQGTEDSASVQVARRAAAVALRFDGRYEVAMDAADVVVRESDIEAPVLELYRQLPMGSWKVVFPDKLLQFRPLEGLRADLITLLGLAALAAQVVVVVTHMFTTVHCCTQIRFDSLVLELISLVSASVFLTRVVLGYQRMSYRYSNIVNTLLRSNMVASQQGALLALAAEAARQQFRQAALAYAVLLACTDSQGMTARSVKSAVERVLERRGLVVDFAASEALSELQRLELVEKQVVRGAASRWVAVPVAEAKGALSRRWQAMLDQGARAGS